MTTVGYLEGTDPLLLTRLAVKGVGTFPLSNGFDQHGKYINHITPQDGISVVIGYLHKILPPDMPLTFPDLLFACLTHGIPVLLVAERAEHEEAWKILGEGQDHIRLVDPADLYQAIQEFVA